MPEGLGPRMAIETAFLVLLAVGCAVADLDRHEIVLVMAAGWILVVAVELLAWRARPGWAAQGAATSAVVEEVAPAPAVEPEPVAAASVAAPEYVAPPPPAPPATYEEEFGWPETPAGTEAPTTVLPPEPVEPPPASLEPEEVPRPVAAEETAGEPAAAVEREHPGQTLFAQQRERTRYRLEPLKPRPRRRFFGLLAPPAERREEDRSRKD